MTPQVLYLLGTAAIWVGWFATAATLYRLLAILMRPPGPSRSQYTKGVASSAITAALSFVLAAALPMQADTKVSGISLPIVWPVMPFTAWGTLFCLGFALYRAYQLVVDRPVSSDDNTASQTAQYRVWTRQATLAVFVGTVLFWLFKRSGDTITVVRGAIPFSLQNAMILAMLAVAAVIFMALTGRAAKTRGLAKTVAAQLALLIGSVVFGLPFAWLVITSFKEDQDMSSANGLVWIPKVSEMVSYRDPSDPVYETNYKDTTVQATVTKRNPDGSLLLDVTRPMALRGESFTASPNTLKEVDRLIPVVTGTYRGQHIKGEVVKELDSGQREVRITAPSSLAGTLYTANPTDVQAVRNVGLRWQNYPDSLEYLPPEAHYGLQYLKNTLIIVILSVLGTLLSSSLVAYAFSRLKFPLREHLFLLLISTMMLPAAVTLLPTFLIFKNLHMIDTLYPLWLPAFFAGAFNVFLLRQFFLTIPKELEDASKIDGCNYFETFWRIMLPQIKPALAVIAIWTFMGVWNNFMGPLVYINSPENMPIAYAVQLYQGQRGNEPGLLMAFATMAMIPVLLLFFTAQRYFIEGVTLSGLGGR